MFVCGPCHRGSGCNAYHVMVSFGPCEVCRRETGCCDCVASWPVTTEEIRRYEARVVSYRERTNAAYRHAPRLEYQRLKE